MRAALDAIAEQGVGGLRVRAVSARAQLNDRYFYESFRDCQELLVAVFEDQFNRALTGIMTTVAESPPALQPASAPSSNSYSPSSTRTRGDRAS